MVVRDVFEKSRRAEGWHSGGWFGNDNRGFASRTYPTLGPLTQGRSGTLGCARMISKDDALKRYSLSVDEFIEWVRAVSTRDEGTLKATMVQK